MKARKTDYELFAARDPENRRALRREELILEVTEALCKALEDGRVTRSQLARRLGKTPAFVTQILAGGRNLTLKSLADVADALGARISVALAPLPGRSAQRPGNPGQHVVVRWDIGRNEAWDFTEPEVEERACDPVDVEGMA